MRRALMMRIEGADSRPRLAGTAVDAWEDIDLDGIEWTECKERS